MSDRDLAGRLADLGGGLRWPPTPDLAGAVAARLEAAPARGRAPRRRAWRRLAVAAAAAVLLLAAVLAAWPGARQAVARRLGLGAVEVRLGGPAPTTTPTPGGRLDLGLGRRATLAQARAAVGFRVLVPAAPPGRPDAVFVGGVPRGARVDLVWRARPGLPASTFTDAGLLLTEIRADLERDMLKKVVGAGIVRQVQVGGLPAYWFSGQPHVFAWHDAAGNGGEERARLAGNTLVWQRGDLVLRLEGQVPLGRALAIAGSLR